jgi:hypothetical protein
MVPIAQANAPSMCMLKMVWSGEKNSKANTVLRVMLQITVLEDAKGLRHSKYMYGKQRILYP